MMIRISYLGQVQAIKCWTFHAPTYSGSGSQNPNLSNIKIHLPIFLISTKCDNLYTAWPPF
jgi:hypothetical protein